MLEFVYIHIPRCAGRFMTDTIGSTFGRERVLRDIEFRREAQLFKRETGRKMVANRFIYTEKSLPDKFDFNRKNHSILLGHFNMRKYEFLNLPFITFLRNPIDRLISEYSVLKIEDMGIDVVEFSRIQSNLMSWMVHDINQCLFIGFVEELEKSLVRFESLLSEKLIRLIVSKGKSGNYKNTKYPIYVPTEKEIEQMEKYNQLDIDFYNQAYKKFMQEIPCD